MRRLLLLLVIATAPAGAAPPVDQSVPQQGAPRPDPAKSPLPSGFRRGSLPPYFVKKDGTLFRAAQEPWWAWLPREVLGPAPPPAK